MCDRECNTNVRDSSSEKTSPVILPVIEVTSGDYGQSNPVPERGHSVGNTVDP